MRCLYKELDLQQQVNRLEQRVKELEDVIIPLSQELREHIENLTEGVEIDLNEPLPNDEE
jgi:hypothetical protein